MLSAILRLYLIQISAALAAALSLYYPGLDIVISVLFLLIIAVEGQRYDLSIKHVIYTALIWQAPAILYALIIVNNINIPGISEYAIFILEFWFTPLVGILSLANFTVDSGRPLYYYLLVYLPFIISLYYIMCASVKHRKSSV